MALKNFKVIIHISTTLLTHVIILIQIFEWKTMLNIIYHQLDKSNGLIMYECQGQLFSQE